MKTNKQLISNRLQRLVVRLCKKYSVGEIISILECYDEQVEGYSLKERKRFGVFHENSIDGG